MRFDEKEIYTEEQNQRNEMWTLQKMKWTYLPYTTYNNCTVVYKAVCYLQEYVVCDNCKLKRHKLNT